MEEGYASGLSQGILQGIEQGIEQGITQGITQTAINLLKSGLLTDVQIKELTGIDQKQLDELKKDINKNQ